MTLPLIIFAAGVVAGLTLLARGWRGTRTDTHPLCQGCGFDLFGLPNAATRCSECGADLTRPRSIRVGHRARRPGLIASGSALLLACAAVTGAYGWAWAKDVDLNTWKPLGWLVSETKLNHTPATRTAAFAELMRRLQAGKLDAADVGFVADAALAHQADTTQPWLDEWGEILHEAHARKLLSSDQWQRYGRQAGSFTLAARPRVRRGDPLPLNLMQGITRGTSSRTRGHL